MVLDRRRALELARALEYARSMRRERDILEHFPQTSEATEGKTASQPDKLMPTPHPHLFRDSPRFTYSGERAGMARKRGVPPYEQLAENVASDTLSRLANLQAMFGKPSDIHGAYGPGHAEGSQHKLGPMSTPAKPARQGLVETCFLTQQAPHPDGGWRCYYTCPFTGSYAYDTGPGGHCPRTISKPGWLG